MKRTKDRKWLYILVSVLIATVLWLFVRLEEDPEMENRERGIPVITSGEHVLESQGLMVDYISDESVTLTWKGSWRDISKLNKNSVKVSVDVSHITEPGEYELEYTPRYPANVASSGLSVESAVPRTIKVKVEKIYFKTVDIETGFSGETAEGYMPGEIAIEPKTVKISGTKEKVDRIQTAVALIERDDLKESFSGSINLRFLDAAGNPVDTAGLRLDTKQVNAFMPVLILKEIPLSIDFIAGGGANENNIKYEIEPKSIRVSGPEDELKHLDKITLGEIKLADVVGDYEEEYTIDLLSSELNNVSGIEKATVRVSVAGLVTKRVFVTSENIVLENIPENYTAKLYSTELPIELRGTPEAIEKVVPQQIRVVVDLSGVKGTGSRQVDVKVLFAGDNVGVIDQKKAVVMLSRK